MLDFPLLPQRVPGQIEGVKIAVCLYRHYNKCTGSKKE